MVKTDLLVIGGGMAGAMAAIAGSKAGLSTTLIRRGSGATALSSGAVDLDGTVGWMRYIGRTGDQAAQVLEAAVQDFQSLMAEVGYPYLGSLEEGMQLLNSLGTAKWSALAPCTFVAGDLTKLDSACILFVGVSGYPDFDAPSVSRSAMFLSQRGLVETQIEADAVEIPFPRIKHTANINGFELARLMEEEAVASEVAERVSQEKDLSQFTHVAFPPILGLNHAPRALQVLETETGTPCFEVVAAPPSVPGYRLRQALDRAMEQHGVRVIHACVDGFSASEGSVRRITAVQKETNYAVEPEIVVLATGKFIGGGIEWTGRLREPIFDLPVFVDGRYAEGLCEADLLTDRFTSEQRIFSAGLKVDHNLRPLSPEGHVVYTNVMAAGGVLTGYNYLQDGGGLGIPLVTGHLCAHLAQGVTS
jgi:glycerol-3-phosphate dehydrogenase subunit B